MLNDKARALAFLLLFRRPRAVRSFTSTPPYYERVTVCKLGRLALVGVG